MAHRKKLSSADKRLQDLIDSMAADIPMRGMKTVKEALDLEIYPMSKADINYTVGDIEVEDGNGGYIAVRDLTDRIRQDEFDSPEEVMLALKMAKTHGEMKRAA